MESYTKPPRLPPVLVLFIGVFIASSAAIMIRLAQREASSLVIAAYRLTIATLVLFPLVLSRWRKGIVKLNRRQNGLILLSGVFLAVHFATWISSLQYTSVASAAVLVSTTPLWVAVFSPIFLKENLSRAVIIGIVVSLFGGVLVGISELCVIRGIQLACPPLQNFMEGKAIVGNLLALAGAVSASAYLLVGRWLRSKLPLIIYITSVYGIAAVCLIVLVALTRQPLAGFSWKAYLAFLGLAIGPQLLGHTSINYGVRHLPATFVSVALLAEPVGSTLLAIIILHESPSLVEVFGGVVILVGIYLASREQKPAAPPETVAQQVN